MHLVKILGALPAIASEYSARLDMYKYELPADQALVRMPALMIDGRMGMLAFWIAITHGDELALPVPETSPFALEAQVTPMANVPRM